MFKIIKVLNHNAVISRDEDTGKEYLMLGKGIGFGKKILDQIKTNSLERMCLLQDLGKDDEMRN